MYTKLYVMLAIVAFSMLWRLVPHEFNMTPMFAMALFSGVLVRQRWLRYALPLVAMLVTDFIIGLHLTMPFVYAGLLFATFLGRWVASLSVSVPWYAGASLVTSLVFFVISNIGVWLVSGLYTLNMAGLVQCFVMALPFLWKTVAGDLFFVMMFYALVTLVSAKVADKDKEALQY